MSIQSVGSGSVVLGDLVTYAEDGIYKLPTIQREFVWKEKQIKGFIESLYKGYPVGLIVFWMPKDKAVIDSTVFLDTGKTMPDYSFILDGQQRVTSMLLVKHNFEINRNGRKIATKKLYFNPEDENFSFKSDADEKHWINVHDVFIESQKYYENVQKTNSSPEVIERLKKLRKALTSRLIPSYAIGPEFKYEDVAKIFLLMNSAGVRIGTVDMFFSLLASKFEKDFKEDILKFHYSLNDSFGTSLRFVVRSLAAVCGESQANFKSTQIQNAIERLIKDPNQLRKSWDETKVYINETIKILRDLGLEDDSLLPSENALVPLMYYLYKKGNKISVKERNGLILWFLLVSFFERYSASVDTRLNEDLESISKDDSLQELFVNLKRRTGRLSLTLDDFSGAYSQRLLLLMLMAARAQGATDWFGGTLISSKGCSRQHIFPVAFLKANGVKDWDQVNDIANITILSLHANIHMGKNPPEEYFMRNYVGTDKIEKHFMPTDTELWKVTNYQSFLNTRRKLVAEGIISYLNNLGLGYL